MVIETLAMAAAGLALQAYGTSKSSKATKQAAEASAAIARQEQLIEAQKFQAMILADRRSRLEAVRNFQRARATALTTATAQGAAQGSALGGAYGQQAGQYGTNILGLSQNLEIGRNIFAANAAISQQKQNLAYAQASAAEGAGYSSLGGSLIQSAPTFGGVAKSTGSFLASG